MTSTTAIFLLMGLFFGLGIMYGNSIAERNPPNEPKPTNWSDKLHAEYRKGYDAGVKATLKENVIKGLECCLSASLGETTCPTCTYRYDENGVETGDCEINLLKDAITLLKAQEPVAPIFDYDGRDVWRCGNCHRNIFHPSRTDEDENEKNYRGFCFHCGRAVKWNG